LIKDRDHWRTLALSLQAHVVDTNDRLLVREGAYRKMEPMEVPKVDPLEHETDTEWMARREQEEIEEHVRRAEIDPMWRQQILEAAEFDPEWAKVAARLN
jgi:hypothetical protein